MTCVGEDELRPDGALVGVCGFVWLAGEEGREGELRWVGEGGVGHG